MFRFNIIVPLLCYVHQAMLTDPSVIIIGAGPAGIAAATKLLDRSLTNITVLEAEDRIGGRIHSLQFGDGIVDLGAQYCHGQKGNVAYELAKNYNILEPSLRGMQDNVYHSNGSKLNPSFVHQLQEFYFHYHEIDDVFNNTERSLGDVIIHKYNNIFRKQYENDEQKLKMVEEGLRFLEGHIVIHEGTFSWFDTSAECDYKKCEGPQNLIWKGMGYKAILEIMTRNYPNPNKKLPVKIYLNTTVEKIIWNEGQTVKVVTSDKEYSANYVIFAASVGVLKQQKDFMFDPPLPSSKQEAITATGFSGVMKIFFYFPKKWWKDEDQAFAFFWGENDLKIAHLEGPTRHGISWVTQLRYILKVPDNPNVWVGWVSGDLVPEIEKLPVDILKTGCAYVFQKFLGKSYNVSEVGNIIRSAWITNKNFGGTYSYTKTGFYRKGYSYQAALAEPLTNSEGKPVVLFAGEATNLVHYSTVHGAIETGYREAERIIKIHKTHS